MAELTFDRSTTTRRGDYRPAAPETPTRMARLVFRAELTAIAIVLIALALMYFRMHKAENTPIKIAGFGSTTSLKGLPEGFEALAGDGFSSDAGDAGKGLVLYAQSCTTCHGQNLQGMPHQGVNLRQSKFVAATNDPKLVAFIKIGRKPADPGNTTGLLMPPRGGNPTLDDDALGHIVAYLRQVQSETRRADAAGAGASTKPFASIEP